MDSKAIAAFLKTTVPLFESFDTDRLTGMIGRSRVDTFEGGEAVIECGEPGRFLGVMFSGSAQVSVADDSGDRHVLAELSRGDIFGEISLMTGDMTVADVIGVTRCSALFIPSDVFSEIVATHPSAIRYLSRLLRERSMEWEVERRNADARETSARLSSDPYGLELASRQSQQILILNVGASLFKWAVLDTDGVYNQAEAAVRFNPTDSPAAIQAALTGQLETMVQDFQHSGQLGRITMVAHRVVHGGRLFQSPAVVDDTVITLIESLNELAPYHNPFSVAAIRFMRRKLPLVPQVAVFDNSFHQTMPPYSYLYGIPYDLYKKDGIRRYGFHGMSHLYAALKASQFLKRPFGSLEIVTCHLGRAASMCAVDHGRSVDTTMGFTPSGGIPMALRSGDLDPGVLIHLMKSHGYTADSLEELVNRGSGMKGISGMSGDMQEIEQAASTGDHRALLAYKSFCYSVRKQIGAYVAAMQGLDVIVFTGGVGEGSAGVRSLAVQGLGCMGIALDEARNRAVDLAAGVCRISREDSPVIVLVVQSDEARMIAREALRTIESSHIDRIITNQKEAPIPVEVSAHHVHLCRQDVELLFGAGHVLTSRSPLSQPGQFACEEQVNLIGPKGRVERVRVLGPERNQSQVEISMTEQFKLGIHPPIRESGDLEKTPGITLEGTAGTARLDKGVICAMRHVHMAPEDALRYGLRDKYIVRVRIAGDRELVFGDVLIRVSPNYRLAMHIDTDEANAAHIATGARGFIDGIQERR